LLKSAASSINPASAGKDVVVIAGKIPSGNVAYGGAGRREQKGITGEKKRKTSSEKRKRAVKKRMAVQTRRKSCQGKVS
jgi:hypothetical protein